jgi:uncharacterized protein (UPF0333 family)
LKRKTPKGIWALRAVTISLAVVVIIVVGTVVYSGYEDYTALRAELAGGTQQAVGRAVLQGSTETVSINITVFNRGLYPLDVSLTCYYPTSNVLCQPADVNVPAGEQGVLSFRMTVFDLPQFESSGDHVINGTVAVTMAPFVSLTIGTDFGGFVSSGGA